MKVLLVGNIANNSYNNAKFLRRKGIEADVLCYNYTHIMSQPEWEDADFTGRVDHYFPNWSKIDFRGFKRPSWFYQETLIPAIPRKYRYLSLIFANAAKPFDAIGITEKVTPALYRFYCKSKLYRKIPKATTSFLRPFFYQSYYWKKNSVTIPNINNSFFYYDKDEEIRKLTDELNIIEDYKKTFTWRRDNLVIKDFLPYLHTLHWFANIFKKYDLIHACATDPIYAMLAAPDKPYVAFEHGTLRDIPLENSPRGRLLSLAYRKAKKVIITNPDTIKSAKKLRLDNYTFIPHPLDETKYIPKRTTLYNELRNRYSADFVLLCPVRHDWSIKGTDIAIKGFAEYIKREKAKAILILADWGMDVQKSKRLINRLGIAKNVIWVAVLNETKHIEYINASDIILDQTILPSFGAITYKAMSCGKPVINSFRYEVNSWCFEEPPPLVSAFNEEQIYQNIKELLGNKKLREEIGRKAREWILKYHSWELVANRLIEVYKEALN